MLNFLETVLELKKEKKKEKKPYHESCESISHSGMSDSL